MLMMVMENQIIPPAIVCQSCLLADEKGQPRQNGEKIGCARLLSKTSLAQADSYTCQMGFRIVKLE